MQGSFFPDWLEPRRRVDKALFAVVMEGRAPTPAASPPERLLLPW